MQIAPKRGPGLDRSIIDENSEMCVIVLVLLCSGVDGVRWAILKYS